MSKPEHIRAREWRLSHDLTMADLADLTGWSISSISWMERGQSPRAGQVRKVDPYAWQRYKLCCSAADVQLRKGSNGFDW